MFDQKFQVTLNANGVFPLIFTKIWRFSVKKAENSEI